MISYWEKQSFTEYDYIICGSGISGLSAAIHLCEVNSQSKVLVLERGVFPSGASTKNAGFASFGSVTELMYDCSVAGEEATVKLVEKRWAGLQKLRRRLGDETIGLELQGGYELLFSHNESEIENIEKINNILKNLFNEGAFFAKKDKIKEFGFSHVKEMIFTPYEGTINTGKMMSALLGLAREKGVNIITGAEVMNFNDNGNSVDINVKNPVHNQQLSFKSRKAIFTTNAFTTRFFPDLNIVPGRGQVLITKPIEGLKVKGAFHFDEGYYYFRNVGDRLLLGGARNSDFDTERCTDFSNTDKILGMLKQKLDEIILPNTPYEIEQTWAGIMAFGDVKQPIVKMVSENIAVAARLSGIGISIGSLVGEEVAELVL